MIVNRWFLRGCVAMFAVAVWMGTSSWAAAQTEPANEAPWYASGGIGLLDYEGDEEVEDGWFLTGRLGYDYNERWTLEGVFYVCPELDENFVGYTPDYGDIDPATGRPRQIKKSHVDDPNDAGFGSTFAAGLAMDGLFHFTRWERLDPYLALGAGFIWYGDKVNGETFDPAVRAGGGVMYHFNDEWAIRADARTFLAGNDTEANAMVDAGVVWTWGARIPPKPMAVGGPQDSDGDGLTDSEELEIGTDPYDPDTDKDRLTDGQEVKQYKTNPLVKDTDFDALEDGAEVIDHRTNPLERDTDKGGVADGHEVIEDRTNPLDPSDDLMLFELYIQFDWDKAVIKPEYFAQIDVIGKVLRRNPGSSARIEGHADKNKKSKEGHNNRLSKRRADAVLNYLKENAGIDAGRMTAEGYGFSRPKAENDPVNGNPVNRRVEVYLRGVEKEGQAGSAEQPSVNVPVTSADLQ